MKIIRNDIQIAKYRKVSQMASFSALIILGVGLIMGLTDRVLHPMIPWFTLVSGIIIWQIALNYSYQYARTPRPDQALDSALGAAIPSSTIYHFVLPVNHVLLTRAGPIVLVPQTQSGKVSVTERNGGDRWKWNGAFFKRMFGSEPALGNPSRTAETSVSQLATYINTHAPEIKTLPPIGAIIVFTSPTVILNVNESQITVHVRDLKQYMRKHKGRAMDGKDYKRLREIFEAAGEEVEASQMLSK